LLKGFTYSLKAAPPYFGDVSQYLTAGARQNQTGGVCSHSNLLLQIKKTSTLSQKVLLLQLKFLEPVIITYLKKYSSKTITLPPNPAPTSSGYRRDRLWQRAHAL
jgi:hypothetical protein